jgi:phosphatidylinositol glycan class V
MLAVMFTSCYEAIAKSSDSTRTPREAMLLRLAMPQLILAVLTLTTFHVQIITRISSGYPLIYIWLAKRLVDHETTRSNDVDKTSKNYSSLIIRWMVVYGIVQGGLFASFLPPA